MPGYTHLQVAMPSSFGLWFGAWAECLCDDLLLLGAAREIMDRNPLGSAAGYGSSAPLDRQMTTKLLGFSEPAWNSIYAQLARGRGERQVAFAYSSLAETIGRFASDACLFTSQNFGFLQLPDAYTTGSSIMPQKKNPDVFELIRAHCNRIQGIPNDIRLITGIQLQEDLMDNPLYHNAFCVEEVNRLVGEGVPFRDAYRQVGKAVQEGSFHFSGKLQHSHEGSIGNLCNDRIAERFHRILSTLQKG